MRGYSWLFAFVSFSLLIVSCKSEMYPRATNFVIAQVPPQEAKTQPTMVKPAPKPVDIAQVKQHVRKITFLHRAKENISHAITRSTILKKRIRTNLVQQLSAAKQLKKAEGIRLADILFFVVLAILVTIGLALLHQVGVSTDVAIFIAMGIAVVVIITYIYLHTWIFTA
jgi:hypothetical protein